MKVSPVKSSFNTGEVSPLLYGRTDIAKYQNGCFELTNFIPTVQGPARRRPGTRYVEDVKDPSQRTWLSKFEFNTSQAYVLEFGHQYIRFYTQGGQLLNTGVPVEVATPYTSASLTTTDGTFALDMVQSGDVLYVVHPSYPPYKLQRFSNTSWTFTPITFTNGPFVTENTDRAVQFYATGSTGSVTIYGVPGLTSGGVYPNFATGTLLRLAVQDLSAIKPWGAGQEVAGAGVNPLGIYRRSDGKTYVCKTNETAGVGLSIQCGGDTPTHTYGVQSDGGGRAVTGTVVQRQGVDWEFVDEGWGYVLITGNTTATAGLSGWTVTNTSTTITVGAASVLREGDVLSGTGIQPGTQVARVTGANSAVMTLPATATNTGVTITFSRTTITGTVQGASALPYALVENAQNGTITSGSAVVTGLTSTAKLAVGMNVNGYGMPASATIASIDSTTQVTLSAVASSTGTFSLRFVQPTFRWSRGAFNLADGYPSAVTFFRERLTFAAGQKLYFSAAGDFENFNAYNASGNVTSAQSIQATISSDQVNQVQWLAPQQALIIGTAGGEFACLENSTQDPFGPGNVKIEQHSADGSRNGVRPVRVGNATLFVQRSGKKVKECTFKIQSSAYVTQDMTVLSEHVTRISGITQLAWHKEPYSVVWCVREDGRLLGFTYNTEQDVTGWHVHSIAGGLFAVESVTVIPTPGKEADQLWMIIRDDTSSKRWVVYLETEALAAAFNFYVDVGLSYNGASTASVSGLGHLDLTYFAGAGLTLDYDWLGVVADAAVPSYTITGAGTLTLGRAAEVISVGMNYPSVMVPTAFEAGGGDGTSQGKQRRTTKVAFRFHETQGGQWKGAGSQQDAEASDWNRFVFPRSSINGTPTGLRMDTAPTLFTGIVVQDWEGDYVLEDPMTIRQAEPFPMTIVAIMPQFTVFDR